MERVMGIMMLSLLSFSTIAADDNLETTNSFSCIDKTTFEVDASCISSTIEMNDKFVSSQKDLYKQASQPSDYVMATLLMDPVTLNITVIGHTDKNQPLARVSLDK
ncbi:MAG: hypothetical protein AAGJ37_11125 [Pseudomonadota bacterium]